MPLQNAGCGCLNDRTFMIKLMYHIENMDDAFARFNEIVKPEDMLFITVLVRESGEFS
jgi:hypothetical protein